MKKILFICPYPLKVAAGQRLKFEPHFDQLLKEGYEIKVHCFMSSRLWDIASKEGFIFQKIIGSFLLSDIFFDKISFPLLST